MVRWLVPLKVMSDVSLFCQSLSPREPLLLPYTDHGLLREKYCHVNVRDLVEASGGRHQHRWLVFRWKEDGNILQSQYHSVWVTPEGTMLNVTPHSSEHDQVLFLPDDLRTIEWHKTGMLLWSNVFYNVRTDRRWYDGEDGQVESEYHPRIRCLLLPDGRCLMVTRKVREDFRLARLANG